MMIKAGKQNFENELRDIIIGGLRGILRLNPHAFLDIRKRAWYTQSVYYRHQLTSVVQLLVLKRLL